MNNRLLIPTAEDAMRDEPLHPLYTDTQPVGEDDSGLDQKVSEASVGLRLEITDAEDAVVYIIDMPMITDPSVRDKKLDLLRWQSFHQMLERRRDKAMLGIKHVRLASEREHAPRELNITYANFNKFLREYVFDQFNHQSDAALRLLDKKRSSSLLNVFPFGYATRKISMVKSAAALLVATSVGVATASVAPMVLVAAYIYLPKLFGQERFIALNKLIADWEYEHYLFSQHLTHYSILTAQEACISADKCHADAHVL